MQAFLFTDIESSTRLWEEFTSEMQVALVRHDQILRDSVAKAGGSVVKSTGDGMLAVFENAAAAIEAALGAQLQLTAEAWPTPEPVRVRVGIHVGEGEARDGDYFGPAVNRAARIMAAAHGGQILMSGAAAGALRAPPQGASLQNLGVHRLKDLTLPEDLYQVLHPGLQTEFPAPATLDARPNNLPTQTSEFFGRADEMASVRLLLAAPASRIVTLTGPGGTGKTRLALQVAAEQLSETKDGVFFVDLSQETQSDAAYEAIARTLGVSMASGNAPLDVLAGWCRDRQMLLVLDNFEQVTDAAAGVVELVQSCRELDVLVTSREPLRVRGERVFPVPSLSLPHPQASSDVIASSEAVALFVERARSARPGFALTEENAGLIAEICLRLDGLPLAIELAAARLNVFSPSELMDRIRKRLDVLGAGGRDLPARQRTLWGAIGWSYELLNPEERALLEMVAVFSPTGLGALEAVASEALGMDWIVDGLASLVDKSLIRSEEHAGGRRFPMLQTIREFAVERLGDDPEREHRVREAHADHFAGFAVEVGAGLRGPDRAGSLDALADEIGNLRTAWRHWVAQSDLEQIFRLLDVLWALHDARGWYHAAIDLARDALGVLTTAADQSSYSSEELTLRVSIARALMTLQGYSPEVEEAFREVLDRAAAAGGSARQMFPIIRALSSYYMNLANFDQAATLGRQLLEFAEEEDDDSMRLDGHYVFGAARAFAGDLDEGLAHIDRAVDMYHPDLHPTGRFRLGPSLGVVARVASGLLRWQGGTLDRSIVLMDQALDLAGRIDHPVSLAYARYHHGLFQFFRGRYAESRQRAIELREVAIEHDYTVWVTLADVLEGVALVGLGEVETGHELTEHGVRLYRGLTTPPIFWPHILSFRAFGYASAGDPHTALELVQEAIEIQGEVQATPDFLVILGDIRRFLGRVEEAKEVYISGFQRAAEMGMRLVAVQALTRLVELGPDGADDGSWVERLRSGLAGLEGGSEEADVLRAMAALAAG